MFDARKLLDQLLGSGALGQMGGGQSAPGQYHPAPTAGRSSVPNVRQGGSGSGDMMSQVQDFARGNLGGVAGTVLAGGLASILLGGAKKGPSIPDMSGSAAKLGGLAILGGLAYKAWQNHQARQADDAPGSVAPPAPQTGPVQVAPPPASTPFTPSTPGEEQELGELLVRAMIAAARADGRIDGDEIGKIREALKASGAADDEQTFLIEQLGKPDDLDGIAADARGPELASEVWLAARLTIEPDSAAEQTFLKTLADKLGLGAPLVAHLEATAAQAKQSGVTAG